ncbi:hypothetical protein PGTUg99_029880 [Puccinia graminis f. sp. tritici]|uniref:Uncharacterized protein n=1 Tax=Puccinia graminis f. sp. tritici TaxID=56615 RepID=A0A5B0QUP7_PUCGR|nr:hypothetical protein PGTUg99_029880 [Puccinia graminis f. sp. tritici]
MLGLALAPLCGSSFQTPPIFSSIRSADDPQANPTIDDPRASRLSFPADATAFVLHSESSRKEKITVRVAINVECLRVFKANSRSL